MDAHGRQGKRKDWGKVELSKKVRLKNTFES
jgi:hypothetical protein